MLIPLLLVLCAACRVTTPQGPVPETALGSAKPSPIAATDFSEYPAGQEPADWTRRWTATGTASWTVQRDSSGVFTGHSKLVLHVASGQGAVRALSWDQPGSRSSVRAHARLRMAAVNHRLVGLTILGGGTAGQEDGYAWVVEKEPGFTGLRLKRVKNGQDQTTRASHAMSLSANTFYQLMLEKQGDSLRAKAWPQGSAEPGWQVAVTDTLLQAGWVGFASYAPGTVEFDGLGVFDPAGQSGEVPSIPPDSIPLIIPQQMYAEENIVRGDSRRGAPFVRDVILLIFQPSTSQEKREEAVYAVNGTVVGGLRLSDDGIYVVRIPHDETANPLFQALELLNSLPQVKAAAPEYVDHIRPAYRRPNDGPGWQEDDWGLHPDAASGDNWGMEAIAAPFAWGCEVGEHHVPIAVVDKGAEHGQAVTAVLAKPGNTGTRTTGVLWEAAEAGRGARVRGPHFGAAAQRASRPL